MRKIILFASSMEGGGSERQTLLLLQHLDRSQWQPALYLIYRRGVLLSDVPQDVPIRAFWDTYQPRRYRLPGEIHRDQVVWLRHWLHEERAAVVYDRTYHATLITGPATRGMKVGRVSVVTGPPQRELTGERERWVWLKRRRLARAYRDADAVVAVSDASARDTESFYGLPDHSVITLPSPIDLAALRQAAQLPAPATLASTVFNIACVGRMTIEKGHAVLLQAVHQLRQQQSDRPFHLWLAGDGPLRPQLQQQAEQLGLRDHVTFLGHVADAARLITRCQLLCLPSLYEGLPNVVMEAMALGVPVVATRVGGVPELTPGERCFTMVPPHDDRALSEALAKAMLEPDRLRQQVECAERLVAQRDMAQVLPRVMQLLDGVARRYPSV